MREIAEIVSISIERVVDILHIHLCMRKLCARRVPRLITIDQECIRVTTSEQNLVYFNETWINHYMSESCERLNSGLNME